jgi:hypothetical protein
MEIKEIATTFFDLKEKLKEKRRIIDFVHKKHLLDLEKQAIGVEGRLRIMKFKDEVRADETLYEQYLAEIKEVGYELLPILKELKATQLDPLRIHVEGNTYFSLWVDENGEIQSPGLYTNLG